MPEGDRTALRLALLGVTNQFSPEVLANPAALTSQRMTQFRDDLIAAAPASAPVPFDTFAAALIDDLIARGYVDRVALLPANAAGTQALLFGADGVFNLSDLP
jgi:hypothetical protein